jgi:hypothetical protein
VLIFLRGAFVKFSHPDGISAKEIEGMLEIHLKDRFNNDRPCLSISGRKSHKAMVLAVSKN